MTTFQAAYLQLLRGMTDLFEGGWQSELRLMSATPERRTMSLSATCRLSYSPGLTEDPLASFFDGAISCESEKPMAQGLGRLLESNPGLQVYWRCLAPGADDEHYSTWKLGAESRVFEQVANDRKPPSLRRVSVTSSTMYLDLTLISESAIPFLQPEPVGEEAELNFTDDFAGNVCFMHLLYESWRTEPTYQDHLRWIRSLAELNEDWRPLSVEYWGEDERLRSDSFGASTLSGLLCPNLSEQVMIAGSFLEVSSKPASAPALVSFRNDSEHPASDEIVLEIDGKLRSVRVPCGAVECLTAEEHERQQVQYHADLSQVRGPLVDRLVVGVSRRFSLLRLLSPGINSKVISSEQSLRELQEPVQVRRRRVFFKRVLMLSQDTEVTSKLVFLYNRLPLEVVEEEMTGLGLVAILNVNLLGLTVDKARTRVIRDEKYSSFLETLETMGEELRGVSST